MNRRYLKLRNQIFQRLSDLLILLKDIYRFLLAVFKRNFSFLDVLLSLASLFVFAVLIVYFFEFNVVILTDIGVETIFYFILRTARNVLAYFRPFAAYFAIHL